MCVCVNMRMCIMYVCIYMELYLDALRGWFVCKYAYVYDMCVYNSCMYGTTDATDSRKMSGELYFMA